MNKPKGETALERERRLSEKQQLKAAKEQAKAAYEKAKAEREQWSTVRKQVREVKASYRGAIPSRVSSPWTQSQSVTGVVNLHRFNHTQLRNRARELERENIIANGMLTRCVENVCGSNGFQPQAQSADDAWNEQAEALFTAWLPFADFDGLSFPEHQRLVLRGHLRDGDIGAVLLGRGQLQIVESDYISSPFSKIDAIHYDGVEIDQFGRPLAYWIQNGDMPKADWSRVAARDFLFLPRRTHNKQLRGEPCFTPMFTLFDQLSGYLDAVIIAQRIAACFGVIIKMNNPTKQIAGLPYGTNSDGNQQREWSLEPGLIQTLQPGEEIEQLKPEQPGRGFEQNLRMMLRMLGVAMGLPLELTLLDFSQTNYSSARASLLQAQRGFESVQQYFITNYLSRVWRWRISKFIKDGQLPARPDSFNHCWHAPSWPYLDAVKEIQSILLAIDGGLTTQKRELLKMGIDADDLREERAKEIADAKAKGIPILHSTMVTEGNDPAASQTDPNQQTDQQDNSYDGATNMDSGNDNEGDTAE